MLATRSKLDWRFVTVLAVFMASTSVLLSQDSGDGPSSAGAPLVEVGDVSKELEAELVKHLEQNHRPAVEFVVNQFENHDLVLLGEDHQVADNCNFVASLIEPLYNKGVRTLAWEFTRSKFNADLERLVTGEQFDEQLANQLLRRGPWPTWGYQEYRNILEASWQLNRSLSEDEAPFRVIAVDSQWSQYELWYGNLNQAEVFQTIANREKHMTQVLVSETLEKNEKALLHIGFAHTLTQSGSRLGKVLTDQFGSRVKQVVLHRAWRRPDGSAPLSDLLSRLATEVGGGQPIGFDVTESPWANLSDSSAGAFRFVARDGGFGIIAQSYVFLNPLKKLGGMTWIPGFITEENFEQARAISAKMNWITEGSIKTPDQLNSVLAKRFAGSASR